MKDALNVNEKYTVDNYPYGYLKCKATFGVEFKKNKGFRSEFQTINPKTGRTNLVKNGTYKDFMCLLLDHENGHYKWSGMSMHSLEDVNKLFKYIITNFDVLMLTTEMHHHIIRSAVVAIMADNAYTFVEDKQKYLNTYFKENMQKLTSMLNKNNIDADLYASINFDMEGIKKYEDQFKTKTEWLKS